MGKSSGLVTHMTGFDSRVRIDSGCGAMEARRVRDPEDTGSIPVTLTKVIGTPKTFADGRTTGNAKDGPYRTRCIQDVPGRDGEVQPDDDDRLGYVSDGTNRGSGEKCINRSSSPPVEGSNPLSAPLRGTRRSSSNLVQSNWLSARRLRVRVPSTPPATCPSRRAHRTEGQMTRWSMGTTGGSQLPKPGSSPGRVTHTGSGPGGQPACKAGVQWTSEVRSLGPVPPAVVV